MSAKINQFAIMVEFVLVVIFTIIASFVSDEHLLKYGIFGALVVIGVSWFIINILTACIKPFQQTVNTAILAGIMTFISATQVDMSSYHAPTNDEMGNCAEAEWQIVIKYKDKYSNQDSFIFMYTGNTKNAENMRVFATVKWEQENPDCSLIGSEKYLCYIPLEWAKKNHFPKDLCQRY